MGPDWVALTIAGVPEATARIGIGSLPVDVGDGARAGTRNMQITAERTGRVQVADDFVAAVDGRLLVGGKACTMHFLDFETSMACLPFAAGMAPYEMVAFQFSCHTGVLDGRSLDEASIRHTRFLNASAHPPVSVLVDDREFVDALRASVGDDDSPIFHWAVHERTVLRKIRSRLMGATPAGAVVEGKTSSAACADSGDAERIGFLDRLLGPDLKSGRLVDMRAIAEGSIMAPAQGGRYSMKSLLPAICRDPAIAALVHRLMAGDVHAAAPGSDSDPYDLLPAMPGAITGNTSGEDSADGAAEGESDVDSVRCGTDIMRAFQQLRFGSVAKWKAVDRAVLIAAMERYCKLDTVAMVAVWTWMVRQAAAVRGVMDA